MSRLKAALRLSPSIALCILVGYGVSTCVPAAKRDTAPTVSLPHPAPVPLPLPTELAPAERTAAPEAAAKPTATARKAKPKSRATGKPVTRVVRKVAPATQGGFNGHALITSLSLN